MLSTPTDHVGLDELPISLWVNALSLDMDSVDDCDMASVDDVLLPFSSPTSSSAAVSVKATATELFIMHDTAMLDFDETSIWGCGDDDSTLTPNKESEQLLEPDGSWVMVEPSNTVLAEHPDATPSPAPLKNAQLSPASPNKMRLRSSSAKKAELCSPKASHAKSSASSSSSTLPRAKMTRQRKPRESAVDPHARVHQRKAKQRGYERNYRGRLRDQRCQDEFEWLQCEADLRLVLSRKRALVLPPQVEQDKKHSLVQLVHEERALQEEQVYLQCISKWLEALDIWGVETEASRNIRYEINALPQVRGMPVFTDFVW